MHTRVELFFYSLNDMKQIYLFSCHKEKKKINVQSLGEERCYNVPAHSYFSW